jgi:hypothetical protein
MYRHLRSRGVSPSYIARFANRSESAMRRYMCEPDTSAAQVPPLEVTDRLVALVDILEQDRRPQTKDEVRIQAEWNDIVNTDNVPDVIIADIVGISRRHLVWVGRSHPTYGIQPSADMVARARATEALMQGVAA